MGKLIDFLEVREHKELEQAPWSGSFRKATPTPDFFFLLAEGFFHLLPLLVEHHGFFFFSVLEEGGVGWVRWGLWLSLFPAAGAEGGVRGGRGFSRDTPLTARRAGDQLRTAC